MTHFSVEKTDALYDAIGNEDTIKVRRLLGDPKVDVNSREYRLTPFLSACRGGVVRIIKLFLECDRVTDFNAVGEYKWGALIYVCANTVAVRLLLDDPRIDMRCTDISGSTILHFHPHYTPAMKVLMAHDRFDVSFFTLKDSGGRTPLESAKHRKYEALAKLFQDYLDDPIGTKAKLRTELGYSPYDAGELFAIVVLLCDNYLELK